VEHEGATRRGEVGRFIDITRRTRRSLIVEVFEARQKDFEHPTHKRLLKGNERGGLLAIHLLEQKEEEGLAERDFFLK